MKVDLLALTKSMDDCRDVLTTLTNLSTEIEDTEIQVLSMTDASRRLRRVFVSSQEITIGLPDIYKPLEGVIDTLEQLASSINYSNNSVADLVDCTAVDELLIG